MKRLKIMLNGILKYSPLSGKYKIGFSQETCFVFTLAEINCNQKHTSSTYYTQDILGS